MQTKSEIKDINSQDSSNQDSMFSLRLKDLEKLEAFIDKRVRDLVDVHRDESESEDTTKLCEALAKAQGDFPKINANRSGYFENSNFADLHVLIMAVQKPLKANGLSVTHQERWEAEGIFLVSKLRHSSGQNIQNRIRIVTTDSETEGNELIAALKKRAFKNLLNISEELDPDDNDLYTTAQKEEHISVTEGYTEPRRQYETIASESEEEIRIELVGHKDLAKMLMKTYKIKRIGDLKKEHFHPFLKKIKEYKKALLGGS